MKHLGLFLLYLTLGWTAFAQNTTVSGTIVDTDGTVWANGSWQAQLINPNGGVPLYCNGGGAVVTQYSGVLNGSGAFSQVMADNTQVCPAGTLWQFTFASHTSAQASQISALVISGTTFNISSYATLNITAPRIKIGNLAGIYAYTDAEIINQAPGNMYWNVSSLATRQWTGSIWQDLVVGTGTYLPLTGGTLTGQLNVGTTQFIDSSFYNYFANACAAAQVANATLLLTKTFTNVPTGTYNCNIAVPVGVGSTSALLQAAAGATLTFTGQYSGPFTPWIDIHTNSGAALLWNSPSTLYPNYLGAKGDYNGSTGTNDGPILQEWLYTLLTSGPNYGNPTGYGVPGETYLSNQNLNATCPNNGYERLKVWNIGITVAATTGSPGSMFDIGGCNGADIENVAIQPPGGNPANSPESTSALLDSNGHWNSGVNAQAGGNLHLNNAYLIGGYNTATSDGTGTAALAIINADLPVVENSTIGSEISGWGGAGVTVGEKLGISTALNSSVYTLTGGGNTTMATFSNNIVNGEIGPVYDLTGSRQYKIEDKYNVAGLGANSIFYFDVNTTADLLTCNGINAEGGAGGGSSFLFDLGAQGVNCTGSFNQSYLVGNNGGGGGLRNLTIDATSSGVPTIFNGAYFVRGSHITVGPGTTAVGTVYSFDGGTITAPNISLATLLATPSSPTAPSCYTGTNGLSSCSNLVGNGLTVNGTATVNGTVEASGLSTPSLLTGLFQNYAPCSNSFQCASGTWRVQSGFTDFDSYTPGASDPYGNAGTTLACAAGGCGIYASESGGTPLTANTLYDIVLCGKTASGTGSYHAGFQGVGGVLLNFGPTYSCQTASSTTGSSPGTWITDLYTTTAQTATFSGIGVYLPGQSAGLFNTGASQQISQVLATFSAVTTTPQLTAPSVIISNKCVSAASPAVCGSSSSGYVAVPAGTNSTLVVDTTAVTATNGITFQYDESLGTPLGVTCAPGILPSGSTITARTAATSFTVEVPGTTTGYTCGFYTIF